MASGIGNPPRPLNVGCGAVELDWVLFDADGVIQSTRAGWMEELTAWAGSRTEEFLLAVSAADTACLTGADFGAAMRQVLRQFEIAAPLEDVIDRRFWIEVRQPMLAAVRAVRDLGLRWDWQPISRTCAGAMRQLAWLREDLRRAVLLLRNRVCEAGSGVFSDDHGPNSRRARSGAVH